MSKIKIIISTSNGKNFHIYAGSNRHYGFYGCSMPEVEYWIKMYDTYEKV